MWFSSFLLFSVSHWLMCLYWTIFVTLGWIQLDQGVWSFLCVVEFDLLIFYQWFASIFSKNIPVIFFFGGVFVWCWCYTGLLEWLWECSLLFSLLEEFKEDRYKFFLVYLVEFLSEDIWFWAFVCREFFFCYYRSIFLLQMRLSTWYTFSVISISMDF